MGKIFFGFVLGVIGTIGVFLSSSGGTLDSPWWTGLAGITLGTVLAALFSLTRDFLQKRSEAQDVATTIHAELADRIARCCFDYEVPFLTYTYPLQADLKERTKEDVVKFRPTDPVIYPTVGAKMALLGPEVRNSVMQFYSSLDRWRREIDDLNAGRRASFSASELIPVQRRLGETLPFAERALEKISKKVKGALEIENDAYANIYSSVFDERSKKPQKSTLRQTLSELRALAEESKKAEAASGWGPR